jgi:hypothetical protein
MFIRIQGVVKDVSFSVNIDKMVELCSIEVMERINFCDFMR